MSGIALLKLKKNKRAVIILIMLFQPHLAFSAGYVPLPDYVPAYDSTKLKPVIKKVVKAVRKQATNPVPFKQNFVTEIEMFAGETRVISELNAGRLAVGNGAALSAAVLDDKEILLIGNEVGVSSLHIWTKDGRNRRIKVTVMPSETARASKEVAMFLKTIPKTKATLVGDKVVVEGEGMTDSDLAKIDELSKRYPQIINFTNRQGWEKMIAMDVKVVEFPTKFLREVGIKWGATGGGAVGAVWAPIKINNDGPLQINQVSGAQNAAPITGAGGGSLVVPRGLNILSVLNVGFNAQLNLLEQNGSAVILARPTLSTRSGTKAKFLAGGEYPYSVSNINGTTIEFKPYGIKLDIEPKVDQNGIIRAKILSEVSDIDSSITTATGPALRTRRTESEFNVRDGETIVLSGLLSRDKNVTVDKLPFLGDIPILGALFRSKRYQNNETELVVFVTPISSEKHTLNQEEEMKKASERLLSDDVSIDNKKAVQTLDKLVPEPNQNPSSGVNPAQKLMSTSDRY